MSEEDKAIARDAGKLRELFASVIMGLLSIGRAIVIAGVVLLAAAFLLTSYLYIDYLLNGGGASAIWESFKTYTVGIQP